MHMNSYGSYVSHTHLNESRTPLCEKNPLPKAAYGPATHCSYTQLMQSSILHHHSFFPQMVAYGGNNDILLTLLNQSANPNLQVCGELGILLQGWDITRSNRSYELGCTQVAPLISGLSLGCCRIEG
jgi:hypothetical protein